VTERYHIPGRLDPTRSLLGRLVCAADRDRMRCENRFYLLAIGGLMAYLVVVFLAWAWLNAGSPPGQEATESFWALQTLILAGVLAVCWLGYRPSVCVDVSEEGVRVRVGGGSSEHLPVEDLRSVTRIDAQVHHQHYRLYAATRSFVGPPHATVVLIRTDRHAWILGISPAEQNGLVERVNALLPANPAEETLVA
jgi:hypothetical protein